MNLKSLTVLNDKLQAAIQSENLELIDIALDQMKEELCHIRLPSEIKAWTVERSHLLQQIRNMRNDSKRLEPLTKGLKS